MEMLQRGEIKRLVVVNNIQLTILCERATSNNSINMLNSMIYTNFRTSTNYQSDSKSISTESLKIGTEKMKGTDLGCVYVLSCILPMI